MNSTIIEMQGVSLRYDRRVVLNDIDFSVRRGDFMAITGPNGGGKTSLLRMMLKLLPPTDRKSVV